MRLFVLLLLLTLTSCVSREELFSRDQQTCGSIGYSPGTEEFKDCLLRLQASRLQGHHTNR